MKFVMKAKCDKCGHVEDRPNLEFQNVRSIEELYTRIATNQVVVVWTCPMCSTTESTKKD